MSLIYACIAPHAGDLIPETVEDKNIVALTRKSMGEMSAKLEALKPEVVVIVNPHGFRVNNAMSISITSKANAGWSPEVKLDFDVDQALANAIADKADEMSVPVVRYIYGASGGDSCYVPLIGARSYRYISWGIASLPNRNLFISPPCGLSP
jgi:aromatic ring-opening dioxygenase LigB subunit